MVNVLEMSSEDVAIALGHQDGGTVVRRLYGHRDRNLALDRIVGAYAPRAAENRPQAAPIIAVLVSAEPLLRTTYVRQK